MLKHQTWEFIVFYKHGETPGLGGEVEKAWFQDNFKGKRFVDEKNTLIGIEVLKGAVDETSKEAYHQVDGISGATITSRGVTNMIKYWFSDSGYANLFSELDYES